MDSDFMQLREKIERLTKDVEVGLYQFYYAKDVEVGLYQFYYAKPMHNQFGFSNVNSMH